MARQQGPSRTTSVLLLAAAVLCSAPARACIYKYGSSPDSLVATKAGDKWTHGFFGDDWAGKDAAGNPWVCLTGTKQSPINIPALNKIGGQPANKVLPKMQTQFFYPDLVSNGSNVEVINTGHTIQVEWLYKYPARVQIAVPATVTATTPITAVLGMGPGDAVKYVNATPLQFHFHANSEHLMDGMYYPLELHIVHQVTDLPACAAGCFSVLGIFFELTDGNDNPLLETIWANMPMREGAKNMLPAGEQIPLGDMLPPADLRDYVTYEGSLTTPPCSEGLLWHVLTKPQRISQNQWRKYMSATGIKDCTAVTTTGAKRNKPARTLLAGPEGTSPDDYNCTLAGYGFNFRLSQPINDRTVKLAKAD